MLQRLFGMQQQMTTSVKNISAKELHAQMKNDKQLLVIDVRSPEEYAQDGHIPGSRLLPLPQLGQRMNELPKDRPLAMVCRSGNRSGVACEQLAAQGYTNLQNLSGGMMGWQMANLPVQR